MTDAKIFNAKTQRRKERKDFADMLGKDNKIARIAARHDKKDKKSKLSNFTLPKILLILPRSDPAYLVISLRSLRLCVFALNILASVKMSKFDAYVFLVPLW